MRLNDLVSVIVITYNSSAYVLETLESVKSQTYQNIELIISDDCSTDDTIAKVKKWVDDNSKRFTDVRIIVAAQNKGISANCNQGYKNAQGKYTKLIAGDDLLLPNCIQDNMDFVINNPHISIVFSDVVAFGENSEHVSKVKKHWIESSRENFNLDAKMQFCELVYKNFVPAQSMFITKELLNKMGNFDERFPFIEDYPLFVKITYNGIKLHYFDKKTVMYRIHDKSISSNITQLINPKHFYNSYKFFITVRAKHLPWIDWWDVWINMLILKICIIFGNKRKMWKIFRWINLLNPKAYWRKIRQTF
jgi:alpha-1,3-rhamnosyltransferase